MRTAGARTAATILVLSSCPVWADDSCDNVRFAEPTDIYQHCVLGDCVEYRSLEVVNPSGRGLSFNAVQRRLRTELPLNRVFEDLAPRCADLDGRAGDEIVVVETEFSQGASLAVYGASDRGIRKIAGTVPIGQSFRWLAAAGIADFNGDGRNDIAYVDRPHLARILRIVTLQGDKLLEIASAQGYSNHRIGENFISGGVRDCGQGPELVLADADWRQVMAVRLSGARIVGTPLGPFRGASSFDATLACQ